MPVGLLYRYVKIPNAQVFADQFQQGLGGLLIRKIEGDYSNVVGFPAASFYKLLELLLEEDEDFLEI